MVQDDSVLDRSRKFKKVQYKIDNLNRILFIFLIYIIQPIHLIYQTNFFTGEWNLSKSVCQTNSITNIAIWSMHIIMFAFLKLDSIPGSKYPPISMEKVTTIIFLSWIFAITFSVLINNFYSCSYEPAVLLCIPALPVGFFIAGLSVFCVVSTFIFFGFLGMLINIKKVSSL